MANVKVLGPTKEYLVMSAGALDAEFEGWWAIYPHKRAKVDARKAYEKARAQATSGELMAGVEQYRQHKPGWQQWAFPASWLRAGRWGDDYGVPARPVARELPDWYAEAYAAAEQREKQRVSGKE